MLTIYKILFEVRLLHEFYLTKQDGTSIFSKNLPADRTQFMQDFFETNQRSINSDINYSIPEASTRFFLDHKLKILRTYSGFKMGVEVNRTLDGVQTAFEPVVPLPKNSGITVFILRNNAGIDTYTNTRMKNTLKKIYYLSNESTGPIKTSPFLTNPILPEDINYQYEQGELAVVAGAVKSFYLDAALVKSWGKVTGSDFINEGDRLVVEPFFDYFFDIADNVKQAQFILKDKANVEVYNNSFQSNTPLQKVSVRIDPIKLEKVPNGKADDSVFYKLFVTGDGGYNKTFQLIFVDAHPDLLPWGIVNINSRPTDPAYNIIDNKGFLVTRLNPDGTIATPPPVFEVWIKSRFTFWRYINDQGNKLKNLFPAILNPAGNNLVTQSPLNHSFAPIPIGAQRLPNPKPFSNIKKEGLQNFADIMVPISDTFPLGP